MLLNVCYFVLDGMLQTTDKGGYKMASFSDEHMARLYERFILEYYRQHHTYLSEVKAAQVKWNLTGENDETMIHFLPVMQTDVFLRLDEKILIPVSYTHLDVYKRQARNSVLAGLSRDSMPLTLPKRGFATPWAFLYSLYFAGSSRSMMS